LRETLTPDNALLWHATVQRPDLHLWQEWALVAGNDAIAGGLRRASKYGIRYKLEKTIVVKDSPVIEIYRRIGGRHGSA
jgi:hypothetical protein